jgi:hypothetical protein
VVTRDADGRDPVAEFGPVTEPRLVLGVDAKSRLPAGETLWWKMIARGPNGETASQPPLARFTYDPSQTSPPELEELVPGPDGLVVRAPLAGDAHPEFGRLERTPAFAPVAGRDNAALGAVRLDGQTQMLVYALPEDFGENFTAAVFLRFVRRLLRREVGVADPPSERDRADLRRSYDEFRNWWVRPEIRTAEHLAIVVAEAGGNPAAATAPALPADAWDIAREVVEGLAPLARGAVSEEAFRGLQPVLQRRLAERWKAAGHDASRMPRMVAETIGPFDRLGPYDPAFREATFALAAAGAVSADRKSVV